MEFAILTHDDHSQGRATDGLLELAVLDTDAGISISRIESSERGNPSIAPSLTLWKHPGEAFIEVLVRNVSAPILLSQGRRLREGQHTVALPLRMQVGNAWLDVQVNGSGVTKEKTTERIGGATQDASYEEQIAALGKAPSAETLADWFASLALLQQSAGGSIEFYQQATSALIAPGGFDAAALFLQTDGPRRIVASQIREPRAGFVFCSRFLDQVQTQRCTLYHTVQPAARLSATHSLVATPILDADGVVIGILAGMRTTGNHNQRSGIRPLEAYWSHLVGQSVSSAMIRSYAELERARSRVLLEHSFSPKVADHLLSHPLALNATQREITVLFADLRQSSRLTAQLTPETAFELLSEVLETLTYHVITHDGVLIDYYGDGLAAMWNAPQDQLDHAERACLAATGMVRGIKNLNAEWTSLLPQSLEIGVGIHTGHAMVGNVGNPFRIKYGPRGACVNLASRLETATKALQVPIVMSGNTRRHLSTNLSTRDLGCHDLPGFESPMDLFTLIREAEASCCDSIN